MESIAQNRRQFLQGTLPILGASSVLSFSSSQSHDQSSLLRGLLKELVASQESATIVGRNVMRDWVEIPTVSELMSNVLDDGNLPQLSLYSTRRELAQRICRTIEIDHELGRLVSVEGLFLTRAEASLCALIALT